MPQWPKEQTWRSEPVPSAAEGKPGVLENGKQYQDPAMYAQGRDILLKRDRILSKHKKLSHAKCKAEG